MSNLLFVKAYLSSVKSRYPGDAKKQEIIALLKEMKHQAVQSNDQKVAKLIWCYETTLKIQSEYISSFQLMKIQHFYKAWCSLAFIERMLNTLEKHLNFIENNSDIFGLQFIKKHTQQFQSLFPYRVFFSGGYVALEKICIICQKPFSVRNFCGHIAGEIYDGNLCSYYLSKVEPLEISLVKEPVYKEAVAFLVDSKTGEAADNYCHVNFVICRLVHPFHEWEMQWEFKELPISSFKKVSLNELCPCRSGHEFEKCCIKKDFIKVKHLNIRFSSTLPNNLPDYEENAFVGTKDSPFKG